MQIEFYAIGRAGGAGSMMELPLNPVTKRHLDRSTMEGFSFSFFCDMCAEEWRSAWYDFNPGWFVPPVDPAVHEILWSDQHKAAYERAKLDAAFVFNRCPACNRSVCNECFHLSETGVSDICKDCISTMRRAIV